MATTMADGVAATGSVHRAVVIRAMADGRARDVQADPVAGAAAPHRFRAVMEVGAVATAAAQVAVAGIAVAHVSGLVNVSPTLSE